MVGSGDYTATIVNPGIAGALSLLQCRLENDIRPLKASMRTYIPHELPCVETKIEQRGVNARYSDLSKSHCKTYAFFVTEFFTELEIYGEAE
jgi:hypothetical protein